MRGLVCLLLLVWPVWLSAETRVALVLASSRYEALRPLENPLNDARLIEDKLLALGFEVYSETNRDLRRMRRALDNFAEDAAGADVALIYFAGHGMEVAGQNMLLPVDAPAGTVADLTAGALPLDDLARTLQEVAPVGLLIVDACRTDPFGGTGRGAVALRRAPEVKPGLARIGRSDKLLYAFAAAPGQAASDGQGANSPFTEALARHLATPGLEIRQVLTLVQQDVYDRTRGRQLPYVESGLPSVVFAGGQSALPEREVLLLSMARMKPDHRALIEDIAARHDMPLAPLFGAFLSAGLAERTRADQVKELTASAEAFTTLRKKMALLDSDDPRVVSLRQEAETQIALGAVALARAKLTEAIQIDREARVVLKEIYVSRIISEAESFFLKGQAAEANLQRRLALEDFEKAAGLFEDASVVGQVFPTDLPRVYQRIGDIKVLHGEIESALGYYRTMEEVLRDSIAADPKNLRNVIELLKCLGAIADTEISRREWTNSLIALQEANEFARGVLIEYPRSPELAFELSKVLVAIGDVSVELGVELFFLESYGEAMDVLLEAYSDLTFDKETLTLTVGILEKLGKFYLRKGDLNQARRFLNSAFNILNDNFEKFSERHWFKFLLHRSVGHLGQLAFREGDREHAEQAFLNVIRGYEALENSDPGNVTVTWEFADFLQDVGEIYSGVREEAKALDYFSRAEGKLTYLLEIDDSRGEVREKLFYLEIGVGDIFLHLGQGEMATKSFEKALVVSERLVSKHSNGPDPRYYLFVANARLLSANPDNRTYFEEMYRYFSEMKEAGVWPETAMHAGNDIESLALKYGLVTAPE